MAKIIVLNNSTDRMEVHWRDESDPMPYNTNSTLRVREFRGNSASPTLWTNSAVMDAWNRQRMLWGGPIPVSAAFKRPWEGGHTGQSQHYAGVSFDVGSNSLGWNNERRAALRRSAAASGLWRYIEPVSESPTWVHMDRRQIPPACSFGYPSLRMGSRSTYVLILQDDLNTLGYVTGGLDGVFGNATYNAVVNYQRARRLAADGVVGCATWTALQSDVVGKGRTSTTID
jgi:hypothetical protein